MVKKIILVLSLFCITAFAANGTDMYEYCKIRKVWLDEGQERFFIQMVDENMNALPYENGERYIKLETVGELRYKQYYALALLALSEGLDVKVKCPNPGNSRSATQLTIYNVEASGHNMQ